MDILTALSDLSALQVLLFFLALGIAFGFEFVNGFHDTANAVTTVIYTRSLPATPAVIYSGILNFFGVLLGGTAVAFTIVNLLPVDLLIESSPQTAMVMVLALLLAGIIWNLGTWFFGLPVSSSHALIGSIMGVGLSASLLAGNGLSGLNWEKVLHVGESLVLSLAIGFVCAASLLLGMKAIFKDPRLYIPPLEGETPPWWVRAVLILTCGGVSFAHGSNDGQKGMGLILLVLIGFLPGAYSLNVESGKLARKVDEAGEQIQAILEKEGQLSPHLVSCLQRVNEKMGELDHFHEIPRKERWETRKSILDLIKHLRESVDSETQPKIREQVTVLKNAVEFVPLWVVFGVALALGVGTTIGYKRIVVTVAEKIGKTHLTYAQGAAAEITAALTIGAADFYHLPVSTTQVLSSGVAGTMVANNSGVQSSTIKKIVLAWFLTLPAVMILSGGFYCLGVWLIR